MKFLFIIFLVLSSSLLNAESLDTCYTVQLMSKHNSSKNLNLLNKTDYPKSCVVMEIGNSLTVRCGCYEQFNSAKESMANLNSEYKNAAVVTTYSYRFDSNVKIESTKNTPSIQKKKQKNKRVAQVSENDEELRLILQVFLYKSDLENAYKVATLGFEKYPSSYYWNEKMAEISKWTNRTARSMKHLRNMYNITYDKKIEDELIAYGSESYQYETIEPLVLSRVIHNPNKKNIEHMILIYKKIGYPEKVIAILESEYKKDPQNIMLLTKGLELSLELADLDLAKPFVEELQKNKPYKKIDGALIAKYYYVQQEIEIAYKELEYVDKEDISNKDYNIKYYELKSDLGWYLQDNLNAAVASRALMNMDKGRLADYERISFVYKHSNPKLAAYSMRRAYNEYQLSYLFYSYANEAINTGNIDELNDFLSSVDETTSPLGLDSMYWVVKSNVYGYYNEVELEKEALNKALEISPDNYQIKLTLLYYFMRIHDTKELHEILTDMADNLDLDYSFYFSMASAYFYLSDIDRASYYTQELLHAQNPITQILEFKFLQAYIYQIQNKEAAYISSMKDILKDLKAQSKKNPALLKQNDYLSYYLRAAMSILNPDKFEKKLKKAKPYLSEKNYKEIAYSWAVQNSAYEKSLQIYHTINEKDIWIQFSNSTVFQNHDSIGNLLDIYLPSLSMGDASQATEKDGQIALSQSFTFDGLNKNQYNQNAYIHHRDLSKIRSDYLDVKVSRYNREPLLQKYIKIDNKNYLGSAFYLNTNFEYFNNETQDTRTLVSVPDRTIEAGLGLLKVFDRGSVAVHMDYYDSMQRYYGASLSTQYRISTDLVTSAKIIKNGNALESTQLLLGGKKDMLALSVIWSILDSTQLEFLYEKDYYTSQDEVDLGDGDYGRINIIHQIRNGYPDLRLGGFVDYGLYDETSGSRGVIDELQADNYKVLPNDFYNIGMTFSYGMANADDYTRVWRPYVEVYPYYNGYEESYSIGFNAGYGGKIWHQDHLIFGATYTESVNGIGGKIFELFLDYHFMYSNP